MCDIWLQNELNLIELSMSLPTSIFQALFLECSHVTVFDYAI